ncbi:MAG: hypothetical protein KGL90_08075 [Burkholderiales bacterium]|nr:hypothetical protein [Burkholderiales bacterium]
MIVDPKVPGEPIRLVFELTRADHPRLYDDLIRFPKGTKRINRLRVLAYDGLLVQSGQFVAAGAPGAIGLGQGGAEDASGAMTNDLFVPSLSE